MGEEARVLVCSRYALRDGVVQVLRAVGCRVMYFLYGGSRRGIYRAHASGHQDAHLWVLESHAPSKEKRSDMILASAALEDRA